MQLLLQYGAWILLGLAVVWFVLKQRGDVSPAEARKLVGEGARLIDVRSPAEFAAGHLPGAVNVPVERLNARAKELGSKEKPVVVYCASGARSALAARQLKAQGWALVRNLGAMARW
jgi:rhodanese-related sulfurtransferase